MKSRKINVLVSKWDDGTEHLLYAINSHRKAIKHLKYVEENKCDTNIEYYIKEINLYTL